MSGVYTTAFVTLLRVIFAGTLHVAITLGCLSVDGTSGTDRGGGCFPTMTAKLSTRLWAEDAAAGLAFAVFVAALLVAF